MQPESKKFSLDPQITSFEMLQHIIASAFSIKGDFTMSYLVRDDYGKEIYLSMLSDWDMDAAIQSASDPCLQLKVDAKPFEEGLDDWDIIAPVDVPRYKMSSLLERNILGTLTGTLSSGMGKTLTHMQRAIGIKVSEDTKYKATKPAMSDQEFRNFLDSAGHMVKPEEFRISIYQGGCEPSLRRVAWRHLLNIFPNGLSGKERFEYMKRKEKEYLELRDQWRKLINGESMSEEMKFVTSMVKKDVLRTDRTHKFYSGSDDSKNLISLFNILVTYALTHPQTSYCQGMSDIASPLLVTQKDEAQAYLCFCATMKRLKNNFNLNGQAITTKFKHLSDLLQMHDPELHSYFQEINAGDLFFCYRWILLELKREFPFEDALYMLEVMWSTLPPDPPHAEIAMTDETFSIDNLSRSPCSPSFGMKQTVYAKLFAMRRNHSVLKSNEGETDAEKELAQNSVNNNSRIDSNNIEESCPITISQEYPAMNDLEIQKMVAKSSSIDGSLKSPLQEIHDLEKDLHIQSSLDTVERCIQDQPTSDVKGRLTLEGLGDTCTCTDKTGEKLDSDNEQSQFEISLDDSPETELNASANATALVEKTAHSSVTDHSKNGGESPDLEKRACDFSSENNCPKHSSDEWNSSVKEGKIIQNHETDSACSNSLCNGEYHSYSEAQDAILNSMEIVKSVDDKNVGLPPPQDFGSGNPFLMFLCLALLQQHRDIILQKKLEYDEIAIMFDKLVRKHDVHKILHHGRLLYSEYLRTQQKLKESSESDPSV